MTHTQTGSFPVGFRLRGGVWQNDLPAVIRWAIDNHFSLLDVEALPVDELRRIIASGLGIGSVDLKQSWTDLASPGAAKRIAAAQVNAEYIQEAAALGVRNFFVVVIPEETARERAENLDFAVDGYGRLCAAIESAGARVVIEGWPGRAPYFSTLGCTPAECRALLAAVPGLGLNYDPSHLVRLGINPLRFLEEFASRIHHVHAKDTQLNSENLYQHGNLQPSAVARPHAFGGLHWRYTIPGHGQTPWKQVLQILKKHVYAGGISIELEDEDFHESEEAEKRGLLLSRDFLSET